MVMSCTSSELESLWLPKWHKIMVWLRIRVSPAIRVTSSFLGKPQ